MCISIASIHERLRQAQEETQVLLTIDGRPNIVEMCETHLPTSRWESWRTMDRYLDEGIWKSAGPGFQRLQEWVALHWNPESERRPPDGTVATRHHWPRQGETRLDTAAATRKLIAAARMYGLEQIGRIAVEFAAHGMIEVHCIYMLKGPSIKAAKPLDSNCSLLPYAEALRKIDAESDPGPPRMEWPKPDSGNVCALEVRHFERDNPRNAQRSQYASPLLKEGPEQLALLLGLVWGAGFRVFGHWRTVPDAAEAALPFRHLACGPASGYRPVSLAPSTWGPPPLKRPLAITELRDLATKFSTLPEQVRHRLQRAMARLRARTERFDDEDRAIDLSIALSVLFIEEHETDDRAVHVPQRAAWLYADSACERRQTEDMLGDFLRHHSNIAHGQASAEPDAEEHERTAALLAGADDVLRASLKTMIAAGLPEDWSNATDRTAIRHNPPRTAAEIPSAKSDSLSWSVEEKREISGLRITLRRSHEHQEQVEARHQDEINWLKQDIDRGRSRIARMYREGERVAESLRKQFDRQLAAARRLVEAREKTIAWLREGNDWFRAAVVRATELIASLREKNGRLRAEVRALTAENAALASRVETLQAQLDRLRSTRSVLSKALYGSRSEQQKKPGTGRKRGQQRGAAGHGRTQRPGLGKKKESRDPPEDARICPRCGKPYAANGERCTTLIEIDVEAYENTIVRPRYRRGCECASAPREVTAPPVTRLFETTPYGISVWTCMLYERFVCCRPLHRVAAWLADMGLAISPGTLADSIKRFVPLFEPLAEAILSHQNEAALRHADETSWRVQVYREKGRSPPPPTWTATPPTV